jgi:hypothetical protein
MRKGDPARGPAAFLPGILGDCEVIKMPNIESILRDHVTLQIECLDRLYLNGYIPQLQTDGGLVGFLVGHRQQPIASPALLRQMTEAFVKAVETFAATHRIPFVPFERGQRKEDVAREHFSRFTADEGVVFIGVAQEKVTAFRSTTDKSRGSSHRPFFRFYRGAVYVKQFYFYILDRDFGPSFIKFSTYVPFTVRVWINGHEWAKRQLAHASIPFESLDNGFASVGDAQRAQAICDELDADAIDAFFRKWLARLPHPFTPEDRAAGVRYRLSILQMEMSRTEVFDRPVVGRQFFEEVIRENLDLGRPDRVQLIFDRRISRRTPGSFKTRVLTVGVQPTLRIEYKRSAIKQYLKEGRALRTETTINDTRDFGVGKDIHNLDHLRAIGRNANRRLLATQRLSQNCAVTQPTFERIVLPSKEDDGHRVPGLRFGDPRVMALLAALCHHLHVLDGFTNAMLRGLVAALQGLPPAEYSRGRMTYDLRRLRRKGLLLRIPHTNRYVLTPAGRRIALFFTKTYARVIRRGLARLDVHPPDAGDPLVKAWLTLDAALDTLVEDARLAA